MAFPFRRASTKGSTVALNVATPAAVYADNDWSRRVGPGGGYWWGGGPREFVPMYTGPANRVHLGRPGDFVPGGDGSRQDGDLGFPHASRWPGWPNEWQTPFYDTGTGSNQWGAGAYCPPGGGATGGFTNPNVYGFMGGELLVGRVAIVFTCVDLISRIMASMNLIRTQDSAPLPGLPWMDNPEPLLYSSMVDAMKAVVNSLLLRGNAFIMATARYADGTVARWAVLNPDLVELRLSKEDGLPDFYIDNAPIPRAEILHIKYQVWPGALYGVGPIEAAWRSIAAASAMEAWGTQLATMNGIPFAVLQSQTKLTKPQAEDIKLSWYEAALSRGTLPAVLSGGLTYEPLNLKPSDVGLLDMRSFDEQRIASTLGVPLWLVGLPMNAGLTYSTAQATFDYFWRVTLRSMSYNIGSALSSWALPRPQWIHFDNDSLVQLDLKSRSQAYKLLVEAGVLDPEEIRVIENVGPRPADEELAVLSQATDGGF